MFKIASHVCILFFVFTTVSYGQDGKVTCVGSKIEDWDNCFGTEISGRYQYEGRWIKGKKVGKFFVTSKDGEKFDLNFINGIQSGEGPLGRGVVSATNEVKIEVERLNGKRNGVEITTIKGFKFITLYKDDVAYGSKICIDTNGTITFFTNVEGSSGAIYYKNGNKYEGEVANFSENGKGVLTGFDGSVFDGYFKDGRPHGQGIFTYSSGVIFEGNWDKGRKQGPFTMNSPDKSQTLATFSNDRLVGKLIFTASNGDKTTIEVTDGRPDGFGKTEFKSGDIYEGNFINAERNGRGKLTSTSGLVAIGEFKEGKKTGPFIMYTPSGQKFEAVFENDQMIK